MVIEWIAEIWWSDKISEETIKHSFKKGGINLKKDGSEDVIFNWPKLPDMVLIEDLPSLKKENTFNDLNLNSEDSEDNEDNITTIRKEVIKRLRKNYSGEDIEIDDDEILKKDYKYYKALRFMK